MKLKPLVYRNWQKIQRECRKLDTDKSGTILPDEFVGEITSLCRKSGHMNLNDEWFIG